MQDIQYVLSNTIVAIRRTALFNYSLRLKLLSSTLTRAVADSHIRPNAVTDAVNVYAPLVCALRAQGRYVKLSLYVLANTINLAETAGNVLFG